MSRIRRRFEVLRAAGRKALIPFVTAGDPRPDATLPLMQAMVAAGADLIELGVPFSDPMADGPVIQRASERALRHHVSLGDVLEMVARFRDLDKDTPVVLMGYLNPVEAMGYGDFARRARAAGVDGVLTVDMPPEEAADYKAALDREGLDAIFLLAPTSNDERLRLIGAMAGGFVYYVSLKGVTGASSLDVDAVAERVSHIRKFTHMPVGVGFGIKDAETAAAIGRVADAVVVGSALVHIIEQAGNDVEGARRRVGELLAAMRQALDGTSEAKGGMT